MADVNQRLLHVLDDRDRIVIVQGVDDSQIVGLRLTRTEIWACVTHLVHLEVMALKDILGEKAILKEHHLFLFYRNEIGTFERRDKVLVPH